MKLVPFPSQYIETSQELPFDVFDGRGRLLLAAGQHIDGGVLGHLLRWDLFADEAQSMAWRRQLAGVLGGKKKVCGDDYGEEGEDGDARLPTRRLSLGQEWTMLVMALETTLRETRPDPAWIRETRSVRLRARAIADLVPDASLCHLIYTGGTHTNHYSCHQAMRCMLLASACARLMGWDEATVESLESAALTMNLAMRALQDMLAQHNSGLSSGLRLQVTQHPRDAARLLASAGVTDPVWLGAVMLHHDAHNAALPPAQLTPAQQAAQLLRRVDIFCAKLSRRGRRPPLSGLRALREACLGTGGQPDEIGAALLKAVGLYPPGSFVQLANGERALVLARGDRANAPRAAVFADASGNPLVRPHLRDTEQSVFAVKSALDAASVSERPNHEKLLALLR